MVRPYVYQRTPPPPPPQTFAKIIYVRILELPNILRHQFCCINEFLHTSGCEMIKEMEIERVLEFYPQKAVFSAAKNK